MHWLTFTSTLFFTLLFSSVCEALPARLGPEDSTTSMYLPSPQVRQHAESLEISPVAHTKPTADIRSLYSLYLAMESHHSFPTPSPSPTLSPSRLVLHSILSPMPVSVAQTVSPIIASADDDDDDGHPDGLGIATWLMASIFGLFLSVSVCGLLIRACGQRKPENNVAGVHRILAKREQEEEMKVIDITKECLYSRFSDCSSDAQTFAVDLGVDVGKRGDVPHVRVSQVRVQPRARSVSGILRPFSLLPSRRLGHLRTNSAPERKHRGGVFSFGHAKAVKSVVLESGVGVGDVKVPVVLGDVV